MKEVTVKVNKAELAMLINALVTQRELALRKRLERLYGRHWPESRA